MGLTTVVRTGEIDVAMAKSWANDGEPVTFPFEYERR